MNLYTKIRILSVEDSEDDYLLLQRHLSQHSVVAEFHRAETLDDLQRALQCAPWDIVISDFKMPDLTPVDVIEITREMDPDIPVIVISGTVPEDQLVEIMRAGANDVFAKSDLSRLVPAIERELSDAQRRRRCRRAESHLSTALENMSQGLCMFDANQRLVFCNKKYAELYGLDAEQTKSGTSLFEIIKQRVDNGIYAGECPECYKDELKKIACSRNNCEQIQELSDGRTMALKCARLPDGGYVVTHEDITDLVHAQAKLVENETRFEDIAEISSEWFWSTDTRHRLTYLSKRFREITDIEPCSLVGRILPEICLMEPDVMEGLAADLDHRRPFFNLRCQKLDAHGELRHWTMSGTPAFDAGGAFRGYNGTGRDRTIEEEAQQNVIQSRNLLQSEVESATRSLKEKAEQLEAALLKEKELASIQREFVSMASHEFRTPLSIISTSAQHLEMARDNLTSDYVLAKSAKIRRGVDRMRRLMESTLALARMEEGTFKLEIADCDIQSVVKSVCEIEQDLSKTHNISSHIENLPASIRADSAAVEQMLTNLVGNAVKYSPDSPDIEVRAVVEDDAVAITVSDQGLGIDECDIPNLFGRFRRAKTSVGIAGTGIGLHLVKTLAELHGGSVSVTSKKGVGSSFGVKLPVLGPANECPSEEKAA